MAAISLLLLLLLLIPITLAGAASASLVMCVYFLTLFIVLFWPQRLPSALLPSNFTLISILRTTESTSSWEQRSHKSCRAQWAEEWFTRLTRVQRVVAVIKYLTAEYE